MSEAAIETKQASRGLPKTREGVVVSDKMTKTVVVSISRRMRHRSYKKFIRVTKKVQAHDERGEAKVGDTVRIVEMRPMSKNKRWRVQKVVTKAVIV